MKKLILGSQSPRRRELLENAGIDFEIITSDDEEVIDDRLDFSDMVKAVAEQKNAAVRRNEKCPEEAVVLTADTMVVCGDKIMGKPKSAENAFEMLGILSENTHYVLTGYCITDKKSGKTISGTEKTKVKFRKIEDEEIRSYIATGEPFDKAGAYGIQLRGSMFVDSIEGDYFNIVGLPVCKVCKLLKEDFGIRIL